MCSSFHLTVQELDERLGKGKGEIIFCWAFPRAPELEWLERKMSVPISLSPKNGEEGDFKGQALISRDKPSYPFLPVLVFGFFPKSCVCESHPEEPRLESVAFQSSYKCIPEAAGLATGRQISLKQPSCLFVPEQILQAITCEASASEGLPTPLPALLCTGP